MFPLLQLGPLTIQTPGLFLLAAVWVGLTLSERYARKAGLNADQIDSLALVALLSGLVGARLFFALRNLSAFIDAPLSLFSLTPAMLDPQGGLLVAVLAGFIYGQRKKLPLWHTLDALTPALAILAVGLGFAHLASGDAFGAPTVLPWGISLWGETRHPSQIYEILSALLIALVVWFWRRNRLPAGVRFSAFLALTAAARLFLETFRGDSLLLYGSFPSTQILAWLVLAAALWLTGRLFQKTTT